MTKLAVTKSTFIAAPPDKVFAVISDLHRWRPWNPWLVTEPDAALQIAGDGKHYTWSGKRTGSGEMRITGQEAPRFVELDLVFLKPFKSQAKVHFAIRPAEGGSVVEWSMSSSLPFFMFFLRNMMQSMIGMDYARGLSMLKDFLETGAVPSVVELSGETVYPGCLYVGITTECQLDELGPRMAADFSKLGAWSAAAGIAPAGDAFSIYRRWELGKRRVKYTSGIPVPALPASVPAGLETGEIPELKTFAIEHVGPYRHLGNAWSTGMAMGRSKEFRASRAHPPFELYPQGAGGMLPGGASDDTTRTGIRFPIK